jgi:putative transposase
MKHPGHLPRLDASFYQGQAVVHWTLPTFDRATGWLNPTFHLRFRELLLHTATRENLLCPIYCLMPDHIHPIWMGTHETSHQRKGMVFLRTHAEKLLHPVRFQPQAFDHVLREAERETGAFARVVRYATENPVHAELAKRAEDWPYTGCAVPGYPALDPREKRFWDVFWKIHAKATAG